MLLYSYHIINSNGIEITAAEYSKMSCEEKKSLHTQIRRHISSDESIRVLSLVGGGIRGYMLGKTLEEIENRTGKKIAQLFDCIVGTSTGVPIAFALSYPQEVTVDAIINNPKLSKPHLASPKFPASTVTKIYSHYGAYIFANPALKRVLDPFIKGKCDGKTYLSAKEIDEQIEHEGAIIKIIAPHFQSVPNIKEAFGELSEKINLTKNLLDKISTGNRLDIDIAMLIQHANFLHTFLVYPLHKKIHNRLMNALKKYLENPALLAAADTLTSTGGVFQPFDFRNTFIPGKDTKIFIEECVTELKKYYLEPFNGLKDSIADYEKFSSTFFDKDGIEEVLKRFLPLESKLQDLLGCTAGVACVRDTLQLRILDNLDLNTRKISSYDAILASVSAQVFFQSHTVGNEVLIDAGCAVKSPSQVAFTLSKKYFPANCQIEIFEIGTAKTPLFTMEHPQKLTRILHPSDSLYMVMDAGRNSTSAILNSLANGQNPLFKYHAIDFDLGDEVFLEKTTQEYFNKMFEVVRNIVQDDLRFEPYVEALCLSFLNAQPIIPEGLNFVNIPEDGHCLYSAISLYIGEDFSFLRRIVAANLEQNIHKYQAFFVDDTVTAEEYIERLRNTNEWGGELEIVILSELLNRPIIVIGKNGKIINQPVIDVSYRGDENIKPIFIFYNGVNHYNGLILQEGYSPRTILDNLSKEQTNDQVESSLSTSYRSFKEIYQKFIAEHNKHDLLQTRRSRLLKHATSTVISPQLSNLQYFVEAYKKYSATLYPRAPKPCYDEQAIINAYGLPMMSAKEEGIEVPILSIDGGGTRGIWPLKALEYIEKGTGKSISEIFPIKGGTSVGGLISIILSIPGSDGQPFYKAIDVANLLKDADQIFPLGHYRKIRNLLNPEKGVMFDNSGLRKVLRNLVKKATGNCDLRMKDLIGVNVGVLSFDNETLQPVFFSKTSHPMAKVVEVGVCTASAPVYLPDNSLEFNGKTYQMGDGGIPDNNPVWYVYSMFNARKESGEVAKILSLGTGIYLDDHPKRDEAPFWMAPAALLGYGMDSRTISQNSLMDIYSKTPTSDVSDFVRLQWILPTSIDLTSSLPVTIPFESIPECLPIGYSGDNKIVDYNDLATIMAAKRMIEPDFINFMKDLNFVEDNYSPFDHLDFILREQEIKFKQTWAVRLADSIDIKIILLDFLDPMIKQDLFKLVYRTCMGLSVVCEQDLKGKGINPELFFKSVDYSVLTASITREAASMGLNEKGVISGYVHKINMVLNFLDDKKKDGILKFISDEVNKIHDNGYYSEKPEVFLSYLITNTIKFMYNHPDLHEWVDYAERQLYNPNFLHKLAALTQIMPRSLAEPVVYSVGAAGLRCLKLGAGVVNVAYATYNRKALTPSTERSKSRTEIKQLAQEKDNKAMEMFVLAIQNMLIIPSHNPTSNRRSERRKKPSINMFSTAINLMILPFQIKNDSIKLVENLLKSIFIFPRSVVDFYKNKSSIDRKIEQYKEEEATTRRHITNIKGQVISGLRDFRGLILFGGESEEAYEVFVPLRECANVSSYEVEEASNLLLAAPPHCIFRDLGNRNPIILDDDKLVEQVQNFTKPTQS